nr:MAG TPA: hypothetical protein [Caudoviricetes sp.]
MKYKKLCKKMCRYIQEGIYKDVYTIKRKRCRNLY